MDHTTSYLPRLHFAALGPELYGHKCDGGSGKRGNRGMSVSFEQKQDCASIAIAQRQGSECSRPGASRAVLSISSLMWREVAVLRSVPLGPPVVHCQSTLLKYAVHYLLVLRGCVLPLKHNASQKGAFS